ncbi:MAG: hypothetical protein PUF71_01780 [Firmicutes bacterium]|nr:hypothetical protein [Bacillota bacterium]
MEIRKGITAEKGGTPTAEQLDAINALAKTELNAQEVYVFSLRLCDDRVDRDGERFDTAALPALAALFVGKTGIRDHNWTSDAQVARIFRTEVVRDEDCSYIKAWAYVRRGDKTKDFIEDIEAGIKKEISVGCAMGKCVCSICGSEYGSCGHRKGEVYDGQTCHGILKDPVDAYEFSFVAVPAQREAGVIKALGGRSPDLKELADRFGAQQQYRELFCQAELGKAYRKELEDRVVRLALLLGLGLEEPVLRSMGEKISVQELSALEKALQARIPRHFAPESQLMTARNRHEEMESGYLI